jgi:hypothetical protein
MLELARELRKPQAASHKLQASEEEIVGRAKMHTESSCIRAPRTSPDGALAECDSPWECGAERRFRFPGRVRCASGLPRSRGWPREHPKRRCAPHSERLTHAMGR